MHVARLHFLLQGEPLIAMTCQVCFCFSCQLLSGQLLDANQLFEALTEVCNDSQHIAVVSAWRSVSHRVHSAFLH